MTRFARAKGSKASNERREEDPTPWHVMRQQLANELNKTEVQASESLTNNLKNILTKNQDVKEEVWSEFGDEKEKTNQQIEVNRKLGHSKEKKSKKKINKKQNNSDIETDDSIEVKQLNTKKKQRKNVFKEQKLINEESETVLNCKQENSDHSSVTKKRKIININEKKAFECSKKMKTSNSSVSEKPTFPDNKCGIFNKGDKVKNLNSNKELTEENVLKSKKHHKKVNTGPLNNNNTEKTRSCFQNRKYSSSHTIIANGREIKVVEFEGFLIKEDDASELRKLRNKLRKQNIPKEKIKAVMKLERRKAEKALAREKTNVCFHCRKFGHKFSDCPDIKDTDLSKSGICFKCGSMEHTHFQCKVLQNEEFRYAVCFICKEQGHIARQCPLNSQGQYPKGGSCHVCGEVTHLRKDCPKATENSSSNNKVLTIEKLKDDNLEDISVQQPLHNKDQNVKSKVVKF